LEEELGDFAKILYEKFFLRDVLAKITPGFVVLVAFVWSFLDHTIWDALVNAQGLALWAIYLATLPLCYITGLGLQIAGEVFGVHSPSPRPAGIWYFFWSDAKKAFCDHRERLSSMQKIPDVKDQRERYVVLKEASGNFCLALFVVGFGVFYVNPPWSSRGAIPILVFVVVAAFIMWVAHRIYGARQAAFEIRSLRDAGILCDARATKMFELIPAWTWERPQLPIQNEIPMGPR